MKTKIEIDDDDHSCSMVITLTEDEKYLNLIIDGHEWMVNRDELMAALVGFDCLLSRKNNEE